MKRKKTKQSSILVRILLPMTIIIALQSSVFLAMFYFGGLAEGINNHAYSILNERVINRKKDLESALTQWSKLSGKVEYISEFYEAYLDTNNISSQDFNSLSYHQKKFIQELSPNLVNVMRQSKTNGVFMILTGGDTNTTHPGEKIGIDFRDMDSNAGDLSDEDILVERAPVSVAKKIEYSLSSWWEPSFNFDGSVPEEYYTKPIEAAKKYSTKDMSVLSYWMPPHKISEEGTEVISYSQPVMDKEGNVFAVLGIEVTTANIINMMPGSEMNESRKGTYILASDNSDGTYTPLIYDEYNTLETFGNISGNIEVETISEKYNLFGFTNGKKEVASCIQPLKIYNSNSAFSNRKMALIGGVSRDDLLSFSNDTINSIFFVSGVSFIISIILVIFISRRFSSPIKKLYEGVKGINPRSDFKLGRVNIKEIDKLIDSIEELNKNAKEYENRISEIIRLSGLPIGTFEIDRKSGDAFFSDSFIQVMGDSLESVGISPYSNSREYWAAYEKLEPFVEKYISKEDSYIYYFPSTKSGEKWIKTKASESGGKIRGFVMDISAERREKNKIEYERDHDILTDLLNRRAFHKSINRLFKAPEKLGTAAMIMMDVDNLKYVNDTYGHDYGDIYLRSVSTVLTKAAVDNTILARISGDEFIMFLYNMSEAEIMAVVENIKSQLSTGYITVGDNFHHRLRLSGGISWYPKDSTDCNELLKFADYAMYKVKKDIKGEFNSFDRDSYDKTRYITESGDEIIRLIENEQIEYYLQPIVDVELGRIHGYEALMRPQGSKIKTPFELLTLAKAHGRLYQLEHYTWVEVLSKFAENREDFMSGTKMFINTLPSQNLTSYDFDDIQIKYGRILKDVVVEITEEEKLDDLETCELLRRVREWGAEVAIDDYGSGYNGQSMLLDIKSDYLKIDMKIIRNIQVDRDRQELVKSIISYGQDRGIKVIAEGVETERELACLMDMGIKLVQGFILGRPTPEPRKFDVEMQAVINNCRNFYAK